MAALEGKAASGFAKLPPDFLFEDLPKDSRSPLWDRIETTYSLSLAELSALQNARCQQAVAAAAPQGSKKQRIDEVAEKESIMWNDLKLNVNNDVNAGGEIVLTAINSICKPSKFKRLFIRKCFVDLADIFIQKIFKKEIVTNEGTTDNIVKLSLTGTPGIGKSSFIVYFLYRLLKETPEGISHVLFYRADNVLVLFDLKGVDSPVFVNPMTYYGQFPNSWLIISDANSSLSGIAANRMLWISSPRPKAFQDYQGKESDSVNCHCMPVWEREEVVHLVNLLNSDEIFVDETSVLNKFIFFGGVPRTLFDIKSDKSEISPKDQIVSKVRGAPGDIFAAVKSTSDSYAVSHQLVHMVPQGDDYGGGRVPSLKIASNKILEILAESRYEETLASLTHAYDTESNGGGKGKLFEQYVILRFFHGGVGGELRSLESSLTGSSSVLFNFSQKPNSIKYFNDGGETTEYDMLGIIVNATTLPVMLVKENQPIFDFAFFNGMCLDLFQVTIAPLHDINGVNELKNIVKFCETKNITLRMIVVVPSKEKFDNFKEQPIMAGKEHAKTAPPLDQFVLCVPLQNSLGHQYLTSSAAAAGE